MLLRVENLTICSSPQQRRWQQYREASRKLIDGLSFGLEEGKITALVGDADSGKLTLALALLRVGKATGGAVYFDAGEENILQLNARRFFPLRRQIQLLFPDESQPLNPRQTIGRQIDRMLQLHVSELGEAQRQQRVEEALAAVGLPNSVLVRRPGQLLAAHRLRAAIAKALIVRPKLLICCDITSAIDMTVQAEILNLLKHLKERYQLTVFLLTHDLAVADHMSDHMLILTRGRIVESGAPEDIVTDPKHEYTRRLVASTTNLR